MNKHPALVGIVPRKNLWDVIQKKKWYGKWKMVSTLVFLKDGRYNRENRDVSDF